MKHLVAALVLATLMATPAIAQEANTFRNPCKRGPWPKVAIINDATYEFMSFLQQARPSMPFETAFLISHQLCGDMNLVGDSEGLTERLNVLLKQHGY